MFNIQIVKELYPGAENILYPPMLIHSPKSEMDLKEACESGEYFGQLKKDGAFYQYVKGYNHIPYLFGRTISKKTGVFTEKKNNVPHIKEALKSIPKNTVIIGEIYYPGGSSKDTTKIMGCIDEKAIERQNNKEYGLIHYYMYDIICYDGRDLIKEKIGNEDRYNILKQMYKEYKLADYPFLELAESWTDDLYLRIENALADGEEGMVIKRKDGLYSPGKRPYYNLKAKKKNTADVIIVGFDAPIREYSGKEIETWQYWVKKDLYEYQLPVDTFYGKEENIEPVTKAYYMNWKNSRIRIGAYNEKGNLEYIGTIHSGISDNMKKDMSEHPGKYLNHVATIQMMEVNKKDHTIRHGFFLNLREDKPETDCTIESIFN